MTRLALRFGLASRFSCGGQAAYDRDLRSLSIFKSRFVLTRVEMRNEKPKRPREPFRLLRGRFESNENQYDEFLSFTLHNRFKNYGVDSNCHQSTDAVAVNLPTQVQGRSPGKRRRRAGFRRRAVPGVGNLTDFGGILVATSTMGVQVCVSCEVFSILPLFAWV